MKWWKAGQTLAWGMWRDETRAELCGEGRGGPLQPRSLGEAPILTDAEQQQIVVDLLVNGDVTFALIAAEGPECGIEKRGYEHKSSGSYVSIRGWRQRADAPLCILEELHWIVPCEEPILDYFTAKSELRRALLEGGLHATGESSDGRPFDLTPKSWLYAELVLGPDFSEMANYSVRDPSIVRRLRFSVEEVKALWPDESSGPVASYPEPSQNPRKRGRPRTRTEPHEAMARTLLERDHTQEEVVAILRDAIAKERNLSPPAALKAAKAILAQACIQKSPNF